MKTLLFYFNVSLLIHVLVVVSFFLVGGLEQVGPMPISGGGGGVEIVSLGRISLHSSAETPRTPTTMAGPRTAVRRFPAVLQTEQSDWLRSDRSSPHFGRSTPSLPVLKSDGQGVGAGVGSGSGSESGTDSLLTEIRKRIERAKEYPSFARQQGTEGVAEVRFQINPDGSLGVSQVVRSSGSALLDEAALATLRRATPYPTYPSPLQVKIEFSLRD